MITVIWIFNLCIVGWNIYAIGNTWVESRHSGGLVHFVVNLGAGLTALGLTWNILTLEANIAFILNYIGQPSYETLLIPGRTVMIMDFTVGVVALTFGSWAKNYRVSLLASDIAEPGVYVFLDIYRNYHAVESVGDAFGKVFELFTDDDDLAKIGIILLLAVIALLGGVILTAAGIWYFAARDDPLPAIT